MKLRLTAIAAGAAAFLAAPSMANAWWGYTTNDLNLRTCASAGCAKVRVMPAGSRVWVQGSQGGWYYLNYHGTHGYASARYIAGGAPTYRPPTYHPPPYYHPGPAWPYPRRWWRHRSPGLFFDFRFGG